MEIVIDWSFEACMVIAVALMLLVIVLGLYWVMCDNAYFDVTELHECARHEGPDGFPDSHPDAQPIKLSHEVDPNGYPKPQER